MKTHSFKNGDNIDMDDGQSVDRRKLERTVFLEGIRPEALINDTVSVQLIDMSPYGLMFKTRDAFTVGHTINIKLNSENILDADIKWIRKDNDSEEFYAGVKFIRKLDDKNSIIDDLCDVKNQRKFKRSSPKKPLSVELWDPESKSKLRDLVTVVDMSSGGLKVKIARQLEVGNIVKVKVAENIIVNGEIRWCSKVDPHKELCFAGIMFVKEDVKKEVIIDESDNMLERGDAMTDGPSKIRYFNKLAIAFRRAGRFEDALLSYKRAIRLEADNEVLFFNMARVLLDTKKTEEAIDALNEALKIDSDFTEAEDLLVKIRKND